MVGLVAVVAVALGAVLALVHSLDAPWVKRRLQTLVRSSAGVELDYRAVRVQVSSGIEITGIVVASPAEVREHAPDLLRVGRVHAAWSLPALVRGRAPAVERVDISDVALSVVVDERGRTSFDALSPPKPPAPPEPSTPLSQAAAKALASPLPIGRLDVSGVSLALLRTTDGKVSERFDLRGLSLAVVAGPADPQVGGGRVGLHLGDPAAPLDLELARAPANAPSSLARAKVWVTVDATPASASAAVDLRMIEQTFVPSVSPDHWLHAEARAKFDPAAGRTEVTLEHVEAGDAAATAEATCEVPDRGDPIVRRAHGDVDVARILRWLPAGLVPVSASAARLRYQVDSLVVGPVVHFAQGGSAAVDGRLSAVAIDAGPAIVHVAGGELSLRAQPAEGGGIAGKGTVKITGVRVEQPGGALAADDVAVDLDGRQGEDGAITGALGVRFARLERGGAAYLVLRDGHVELRVDGLRVDTADPLATRGDVRLATELGVLDLRAGSRVLMTGASLRAHSALAGGAPYAIELEAPVARLQLSREGGKLLVDSPARLEVRAKDLRPNLPRPAASAGVVHLGAELGDVQASIDATKTADAADFALDASAKSLKPLVPFLPPALVAAVPWERMALRATSRGRVEHLAGEQALAQTGEIDLDRPAFEDVHAQSVALKLTTQGTVLHPHVDLDLAARGLAIPGASPADDHVTLSADVDRAARSAKLDLATEGRAKTKVSATAAFDSSRRALTYAVDAHLGGLAPLAPFAAKVHGLDAFDLGELDVALTSRGSIAGVLASLGADGSIALEPNLTRTAAVEGTTDLKVSHFHWSKGDTAVLTPGLALHAEVSAPGGRRAVKSRLEVGAVHVDLGSHDIDLNGITDEGTVTFTGDLADPEIELAQTIAVRAVAQDLVPEYPLGDLALSVSAERGREGMIHVSDLKLANGAGGTTLDVQGNVYVGAGRRSLSLTTALTQDLARLSTIPERFKGRGQIAADASVASPDFTHYVVRAAVKGEEADIALPRAGIEVGSANGEVPITVALEVHSDGVTLERTEKRSPYSMLRFADQHPLLSRSGFLSVAHLKTPFATIEPLVGNLEIEQNVISLRQFEMGVRGGRITGQCGVDWDGPRSSLELHVRATGVQSSHGEPFDGNIAVAVSAADRTVEGRAEILRIGERHLLDLLDLQDPLHVDPAMNRIRTALNFGYPKNLRLVFDHGFASAHLELGGLASLVSIGELRGIPMGPIVDKALAPILDGADTKETP